MALQKEKVLSNGITAGYWRICQFHVYRKLNKVDFYLSLFLDSNQTAPVGVSKKLSINLTSQEMQGDLVAIGYEKIKDIANSSDLSFNPILNQFKELKGCEDV